eukprot:Gb_17109 [translate_table: standard]
MSFRGGRGGRFGGRRPFIPPIKDENGVVKKPEPPALFPKIETLPDLPEITKKDEELVSKRRRLETFWSASPYYIEKPKQKAVGVAAEIERYSDKYKPNLHVQRPPLSSVLKLAAAYFPPELLSQGLKRGREYRGTSQWTLQPNAATNDLQRLDHLEKAEKKTQEREGKEDNEKKEGEGEDGEEEEIEEEEEDLGDDDYNQNFGFDDDDEYLDMDDGDDEGPTF